jgi:hypothetical protein
MKVNVKDKVTDGEETKTVIDPHMRKLMKRLGRDRSKRRQVDIPDDKM